MMTPSLIQLLQLLADGEFHSGSAVGEVMGVSRTAVWKSLQKLADMGLSIESVKGKGYRIEGGIELLSEEGIRQGLSAEAMALYTQIGSTIDVLAHTDSTNNQAMARAVAGNAKGYLCLAEYQHSGKGRRGRQWLSPFGHNIYLSLVWEFEEGIAQLEGLSLAVGVVIAGVLEQMGAQDVALKWPNDILLQQRKLGGVLLEVAGDPSGVCQVVIGIGLNVRMQDGGAIDQPWASLSEQLPNLSRNTLVSAILNGLFPMLDQYAETGFSVYRQAWEQRDAFRGRQVVVQSASKEQRGVAGGVYTNGALKLLDSGNETAIYGGEVSLRVADDS